MQTKVIIDTNVWVSYFMYKRFSELANIILNADAVVYTCDELIIEIIDVLGRKKFKKYIDLPIESYINFHNEIAINKKIVRKYKNSPDVDDNFLYDLAMQTNSKILVTKDGDLQKFKTPVLKAITILEFKNFKNFR